MAEYISLAQIQNLHLPCTIYESYYDTAIWNGYFRRECRNIIFHQKADKLYLSKTGNIKLKHLKYTNLQSCWQMEKTMILLWKTFFFLIGLHIKLLQQGIAFSISVSHSKVPESLEGGMRDSKSNNPARFDESFCYFLQAFLAAPWHTFLTNLPHLPTFMAENRFWEIAHCILHCNKVGTSPSRKKEFVHQKVAHHCKIRKLHI